MLKGERAPTDRWSLRDGMLAIALTQLEAQLCSGCGQPQWLGFDASLGWEVDDAPMVCRPCTVRETTAQAWMRAAERGPKSSDDDGPAVKAPGALRWMVRPWTPENDEQPTPPVAAD